MTERQEALVFDYDGVLADTEALHWKSWKALVSPYGVSFSWDDYCRLGLGVADDQIVESLKKHAPILERADLIRQNTKRKQMVREWSLAAPPIPPQTIEILSKLDGYRLGLVTSSDRSEVEPVLRVCGIFERFEAMVFGNDVIAHKPAPEPYLLVAEKLGVHSGIAFEDSGPGIESARAAGFTAIKIDQPSALAGIVAGFLRDQTKAAPSPQS